MTTLSVLDQTPQPSGQTAAQAIANTLDLAQAAERWGYERYWVAEHHNSNAVIGSAPEIMIAAIAAATQHIRVGSAGVMLPHYSPLKVAELFRLLETLHPGRIDLGLGRAPGTDGKTSRALQPGPQAYGHEVFPQQIELLVQFLEDANGLEGEQGGFPLTHPYRGIHASPRGPGMPDLWMLGSGGDGAYHAAEFGMGYCFAHFINANAGPAPLEIYRTRLKSSRYLPAPRPSIAITATVAETEEEAYRIAAPRNLWAVNFLRGKFLPFPSIAEAEAHIYTEDELMILESVRARNLTGSPEQVKDKILAMGQEYGTDDFVIVSICHDHRDRLRSYELLATAFGLMPKHA